MNVSINSVDTKFYKQLSSNPRHLERLTPKDIYYKIHIEFFENIKSIHFTYISKQLEILNDLCIKDLKIYKNNKFITEVKDNFNLYGFNFTTKHFNNNIQLRIYFIPLKFEKFEKQQ